jgi:predicted glycosyltransferase
MIVRPRLLFYVQHLLGIGHLKRAATLARALERHGIAVTLVSGGQPVPGLDIGDAVMVQLDPVRTGDITFTRLVDDDGNEVDESFRAARRARLLEAFAATRPHVVVTELFPFGRRQLRGEIMPLVEAAETARQRPALVSSVRDILVEPSRPERRIEMVETVERHFDLVLVHGDATLIPFGETFPLADRIRGRIRYTGYVVEPPPARRGPQGTDEVIVSAGGGALSEPLLKTAIAARPSTPASGLVWRLLAGPALPADAFDRIRAAAADPNIVVERARPDFTTVLANCTLSISQGGYNTVMEVLAARCRAVVAPYAGGRETEQTLRARLLARRGAFAVVEERDLSPAALAAAVGHALAGPRPDAAGIDTGGAETSARILTDLARERARAA